MKNNTIDGINKYRTATGDRIPDSKKTIIGFTVDDTLKCSMSNDPLKKSNTCDDINTSITTADETMGFLNNDMEKSDSVKIKMPYR